MPLLDDIETVILPFLHTSLAPGQPDFSLQGKGESSSMFLSSQGLGSGWSRAVEMLTAANMTIAVQL
jgi:hypothetical protein